MIFHIVEPDTTLMNVRNAKSENEVWCLRIDRMLFGFRIHVGKLEANGIPSGYEVDICCGDSGLMISLIWNTISKVLESVPESISLDKMHGLFPEQTVKPIENDRKLVYKLAELIGEDKDQFYSLICGISKPKKEYE
jgi:hypothetical protein